MHAILQLIPLTLGVDEIGGARLFVDHGLIDLQQRIIGRGLGEAFGDIGHRQARLDALEQF